MILNWWGKLLGGAFGFMVGGPAGALLGTLVGHNLDRSLSRFWGHGGAAPGEQERLQTAFMTTTFLVMGHLAKIDGRVSEDEITVARRVMDHLRLNHAQRETAIRLFRQGKQPDFALDSVLDEFRWQCRYHLNLIHQFIDIQLNAAYADGALVNSERTVLLHICDRLGFPRWQFDALDSAIRRRHDPQDRTHRSERSAGGQRPSRKPMSLESAYTVLGLKPDASDEAVKLSYRRLLNRHHPDKLAAQDLSQEALERANEQTRQVKAAYDRIRKAREPSK